MNIKFYKIVKGSKIDKKVFFSDSSLAVLQRRIRLVILRDLTQ